VQLTEDHSLLNDYLKAKKLTADEAEAFPHKNVIVRALGMKDTVQVDIAAYLPKDRDLFLLCSDGLSGMVAAAQIEDTLLKAGDLEPACSEVQELLMVSRRGAALRRDGMATDAERATLIG